MKIMHINTEPWDSGLTEYSLVLAKTQQQQGHQVLYLAGKNKYPLQKAVMLGLKAESYTSYVNLSFKLRELLNTFKPDIVNAHTGTAHSTAVMALITTRIKAKAVRTRSDARPMQKKLFSMLLWRKTAGFIAANSRIKEEFDKFVKSKVKSVKSEIVLQGIANVPAEIVPLPKAGPFKVGMLARLDPVKGHIYALSAFKQVAEKCPHAELHIAGEDKSIGKEYLKAAAKELGLAKNVFFYGKLNDIYAFINQCHAGLISSTSSEAVARVALEWFAAGRPLVASDVGGLRDIVCDGKNGLLVPPCDPEKTAHALLRFAQDYDFCLKAGKEAKECFDKNFTAARFAENTENFYQKLLEAK